MKRHVWLLQLQVRQHDLTAEQRQKPNAQIDRGRFEQRRRILGSVNSYKDVETPLINAMERLIDFVTEPS